MFGKNFTTAIMLVVLSVTTVNAQTPQKVEQFDHWGVYKYKLDGKDICYALAVPLEMTPTTVNHGDVFFLVTRHSGDNASFEPQFMAGYALRTNSKVTVSVDDKVRFDLFTKDSSAWMESFEGEKNLIVAMRAGSNMVVKATSQRGTNTSYTYSLKGITAALNKANGCK